MGGKKRAIPIEKITNNADRAVAFSKRRYGLYSKATELCLLSGAQVAILATPVSSSSHVSFYAYGHSSSDSVVSAFLKNECPKLKLGLGGRWWEDEGLIKSEDSNELKSAINSVSSMLNDLKTLRLQVVEKQKDHKEKLVSHGTHQEETLALCNQNELLVNREEMKKEEPLMLQLSNEEIIDPDEGLFENLELLDNVTMLTTSQNSWSDDCEALEDGSLVLHEDFNEGNKYFDLDEDHHIVAMYGNNKYDDTVNFDGCNDELDLDVMVEYEKNCEAYSFT